MLIAQIGEQGLLPILRKYSSDRLDDDAAIMGTLPAGWELVVTTDMLVQGVHFSPQTTTAYDVGWRASSANLSDLAAMGADPLGITVALGIPADTTVAWVEGVYQGLADCAQQYHTSIVGGDTVRSPVPLLSITALGQVPSHQIICRSHAQVGDVIFCSGLHGLSHAGLQLLLHPVQQAQIAPAEVALLTKCHQQPHPRFDVVQILRQITNHAPTRLAGMDSSDGLADAILKICRTSGVGAEINLSAIAIHPTLKILAGEQAIHWVLYGGEDFELVLCLPPSLAEALQAQLPHAQIIGKIVPPDQGNLYQLEQCLPFQHFA